jgi:nitroimidazol reductase NimA-like FMN-containing flavoprotein (pyridoxamine 5'-phosphate oxidase superfamily)
MILLEDKVEMVTKIKDMLHENLSKAFKKAKEEEKLNEVNKILAIRANLVFCMLLNA